MAGAGQFLADSSNERVEVETNPEIRNGSSRIYIGGHMDSIQRLSSEDQRKPLAIDCTCAHHAQSLGTPLVGSVVE